MAICSHNVRRWVGSLLLSGIMVPLCGVEPESSWKGSMATFSKNSTLEKHINFHERQISVQKRDFQDFYSQFKKDLSDRYHISYGIDISFMPQRVAPAGKQTSWQFIFSPSANWNLFKSDSIGDGSVQFGYNLVRYWGTDAQTLQNRAGVASGINDFVTAENNFSTLTYTHVFPQKWLTVVVGQYSLYDIDGTTYNNDQQTGFISYTLSQNGSATYSLGSLGAYAQVQPSDDFVAMGGFYDSRNILGVNIKWNSFTKSKYACWGMLQWTPTFKSLGAGQYSFLAYNTAAVPEQPKKTFGWSLNACQNLNERWTVFGRINGATGDALPVSNSYQLGTACANPLNRNPNDVLGVAIAMNKISAEALGVNADSIRSTETVLEVQWVWGFGKWFTITPDYQLFLHPAQARSHTTASLFSIRANFTF